MVTGSVSRLVGTIRFPIEDVNGNRQDVEADVDTGFTGFLTLPSARIQLLGLPYHSYRVATLGDGTSVLMHLFDAVVIWDGQPISVQVTESESNPLVGMRMLAGHRLRMDIIDGGMVEIEKLP